jgi:phosphatidylserine/phosphatidylglycerophosphate/cardiolipin synthase-like enzyme
VKLHTRPLRAALTDVVQSASEELLIAAPYIKHVEANWVCDQLGGNHSNQDCRLRVLTDIRSDSILTGFLDLDALDLFHKRHAYTQLVSLPRLHAKVYIADSCRALVTSANLTSAGLDHNFEYGICLEDSALVRKVKSDLDAYARLGNILSNAELQSLLGVAHKLKNEYEQLTKSTSRKLKADFNQTLHQAQKQFLTAQVGQRSAQALFAEAILYALAQAPLTTEQLHPRVQTLLPDLCNDAVELVINGQRFGKRWKHSVRNAQQYLKRLGKIAFDGEKWAIVHPKKR